MKSIAKTFAALAFLSSVASLTAGIDVIFVTPEYLKTKSVPFLFEISETEIGSVEVRFTLTPSEPFGGNVSCSLVVSTKSLADAWEKDANVFQLLTSKMVKRQVAFEVPKDPSKSVSKVIFLSRSEAAFAALSVYYPRIVTHGENYYVLIGSFLAKKANQAPEPTPGAVTPRASSSTSK